MGWFGKYPDAQMKEFLGEMDALVDLTTLFDDLPPYQKSYLPGWESTNGLEYEGVVFRFPILDRKVPPKDQLPAFRAFVGMVAEMLLEGKKIYVHCKGGHGRSGVFVGCVLRETRTSLSPEDIFERLSRYHSRRKTMSDRMRKLGCPQTSVQKKFLKDYFSDWAGHWLALALGRYSFYSAPDLCLSFLYCLGLY